MKHLFNDYYLSRYDNLNYVIQKRRVVKSSGKEDFDNIGFHSSLRSLSISVKEKYVKENILNVEFEELLDMFEKLDEAIKSFK
ncbi:MAG: hypothetical protein GQ557_01380 [Mycoplasmataceae bacterium]|nr:hypothetical protein [Mycoplasmataceae bacterium]